MSYVVASRFLADNNLITSFVFKAADNSGLSSDLMGIVQGDTILVYPGDSANVSHLIPTITYMGVQIKPLSGVVQNFSSPVYYTVTAQDGATRLYTVIVSTNKVLYVGSNDGNLYALNAATGTMIWKFTTGGAAARQRLAGPIAATGKLMYFRVSQPHPTPNEKAYSLADCLVQHVCTCAMAQCLSGY